ncbi:MAG: MFS transporter [Sphingomonadaceae bacterium]|nr:MFS transporter [Sphingomonadaceae bacterium]
MDSATAPRSNPWVVLATLLLIYIFNFADRYLLTGLVGPIKEEFGIGDNVMGLLMGPAFVMLYIVMGVPFARLADRKSRIRIIAAGCVMWSLATAATGLATGPWSLALARIGVGVGEAAFVAPAYSILSDYFKPEKRGMAFAILGLATYIGQIAGQAGGPAIAAEHGWRMAFFAIGIPGVFLGLLALLLVREPAREGQVAGEATVTIPLGELVALLVRTPSFVMMSIGFGLGALSGVSFGYWGPELFARNYAIDPVEAKTAFAVNFGLAGLMGMLCFGAVSDRLSRRSRTWPALLSALALGSATLLVVAAIWAPTFVSAKWLAIPCGLLGGGWSVGLFAALQYMLPARFRASATALFIAATTMLGYFVGPWLTGALSQAFGDDAHSLRLALSVIVPVGVLGAALAFFAASRLERDRERLMARA